MPYGHPGSRGTARPRGRGGGSPALGRVPVQELDEQIRLHVESYPGRIDDRVVRLRLHDMPRAMARELDQKAIRDYKKRALNFFLRHALGGGGTLSLRVDHQGKTLGQGLLSLELDVPEAVLAATPPEAEG